MKNRRPCVALAVITAILALSFPTSRGAIPEYQPGDIAVDDVITPVRLVVLNREASEALKQRVAAETLLIVLHEEGSADAAQSALRQAVAEGRKTFLTTFSTLRGRRPNERDIDRTAYNRAVREVDRTSPTNLPLDVLAPLWVRGESDEPLVERLLRPLREVISQPVIEVKTNEILPPYEKVRLVPVANVNEPPPLRELDTAGQVVAPSEISGLSHARSEVEARFAVGEERSARFAASFVRPNARVELALTEQIRARRTEGLAASDTYEPAQMIVRKGQTIDARALSALAALREKSLLGTLQTQLEQQRSVVAQTLERVTWIASGLVMICLILAGFAWRLRSRPSTALVPVAVNHHFGGADLPAVTDGTHGPGWQSRALAAEARADRAHAAIRLGVLGWMRERIFQTLVRHRAELLSTQDVAEAEIRELEQRLEKVHGPLQERISAYEKRIAELEQELAAKGAENSELIGARLNVARQQMNLERERGEFGTN